MIGVDTKIAVAGAGSIGCHAGGCLALAGRRVRLLCRPALADAVDDRRWDVVVDTWAGSPLVATEGASVLKGHVERYAYVSSVSVYRWGQHVDERSPLVDAESTSDSDGDYSAA